MALDERSVVLYGQGWGGCSDARSSRDFEEPMSVDACNFSSPSGAASRYSYVYTNSFARCGRFHPFNNTRIGEREAKCEKFGYRGRDSSGFQDPMLELRCLLQQSSLADKDADSSDEETPMEDSDDESPPLPSSVNDVDAQQRGREEEVYQRMDTDASVPSTPNEKLLSTYSKPQGSACKGRMLVSTEKKEQPNTNGGNSALWTRRNLSPKLLGLSEHSNQRGHPDLLGSNSSPWPQTQTRCIVTARRGLNKVFAKVSRPITKLWPIRSLESDEEDDSLCSTAGRCASMGLKRKAHSSGHPKPVLKRSHPVVIKSM